MDTSFFTPKHVLAVAGIGVVVLVIAGFLVGGLNSGPRNLLRGDTALLDKMGGVPSSGGVMRDRYQTDEVGIAAEEQMVPSPGFIGSDAKVADRKVVKSGNLSLLVTDVESSASAVQNLAVRLGGFTSDARVWEVSAGMKSGSVTIRVPAARFGEATDEIKKIAAKVENESQTADDVTENFVDLEARLGSLQAQEVEYLKILKRAENVQDILTVTQYLSSVRSQIEQLQGQLQYLSGQVDMSTISVSFRAEADVEVFGIRWRPLYVAKDAFRNMLEGLTRYIDGIIYFALFLPVLLLWLGTFGLGIFVIWRIIRRFTNRKPAL
ncbi:MAG: hypothetical protein A2676_06200 [Candidatus Sungbacteria bacterium RIFCSPHIGHO2_01_FULL_51_22]|uniref:DUF4349 domain-containing protein n=1 Tax=Candidatus Sungbacteria bacterium RIFCSPHIGHO2_02_FULL_51_29 TaxID=1802273 RepID=A0A1G2KWE5_9BACT|nr:MAG: hypothetical protein A2676_06200 [Candidatus Sungbacteria bacterium RIFCSPHIGHO2_01_FULL_51_22]OHA03765.1 MAG: hypothetical protein A3C16_03330 [Candidatus Sungbacteria bacterium RIFCSPHIGHO2_02_FULL_51_29]OHA06582.1 MAG: hypothetical protein A3B29_02240 [Candidatus Sungbacteria bacterium RIFCSPLOWO2_01_FULL_51_34]